MRVAKLCINGVNHIGLLLHLVDDAVIVSNSVDDKYLSIFDCKIERVSSELVTPYILEAPDYVILSKNAPDDIIKVVQKYYDVKLVDSVENLLGNVFLVGKNEILFSSAKKRDVELVVKLMDLPARRVKLHYSIGSIVKTYRDKALASQDLSDKVLDLIKEALGVKSFDVASVNFGSPYLRYGIELNDDYLIVGELTTGHELVRIEEFFFGTNP